MSEAVSIGEHRMRALDAAHEEYDNALYFPDWAERRNVFAAMDLLDQMTGPGIEDAFYAVQNRLKALNALLPERVYEDDDASSSSPSSPDTHTPKRVGGNP